MPPSPFLDLLSFMSPAEVAAIARRTAELEASDDALDAAREDVDAREIDAPMFTVTRSARDAKHLQENFAAFVEELWHVVEPSVPFIRAKHIDAICEHLQAAGDGKIKRLLVNVPPGHAKSLIVAVFWPAWMWLRRPGWRVLTGSYAMDLAIRDATRSRELIESAEYGAIKKALGLTWSLSKDQNLKSNYQNSAKGFRMALSVGSKATGFRGDCFRGDTLVETERGPMPISEIASTSNPPRVWSFNHATKRPELARVLGARAIPNRHTVSVSTSSGRVVHCTDDHRIFTRGRGYVRARDLVKGDEAVAYGSLPVRPLFDIDGDAALRVQETGQAAERRDAFLQQSVLVSAAARHAPGAFVSDLRKGHGLEDGSSRTGVLFGGVRSVDENAARHDLPGMLGGVSSEHLSTGLLLGDVRGPCAFSAHDWRGQFPLQTRAQLPGDLLVDFGADLRARRGDLRNVLEGSRLENAFERESRSELDCAPHRREAEEQRTGEPDHAVSDLSCGAPQITSDTFSESVADSDGTHTVYDIQVEGNCNFFAGGLLVHNCLIFDDLVNVKEAHKITRESLEEAKSWWKVTMSSRLNDLKKGIKIGIMQRVSEFDPCEDLIRSKKQDGTPEYDLLALPTEYDPDLYKSLGRADATTSIGWRDWRTTPGELLFPELFDEEVIAGVKQDLGSLAYAAQHGQRPAPSSGGFFQRSWWGFWVPEGVPMPPPVVVDTPRGLLECRQMHRPPIVGHTISADFTFKETVDADNVSLQVWGYGDAEGVRSDRFLLDQILRRMDFVTSLAAFESLCETWPEAGTKLVEDKANGSAVISSVKSRITGVIAINPLGGKEARANAVSPLIESGHVWLPHPVLFPWVADFLLETSAFPKGAHDDQVDAMTQFLSRKRIIVV